VGPLSVPGRVNLIGSMVYIFHSPQIEGRLGKSFIRSRDFGLDGWKVLQNGRRTLHACLSN
jgi:hypothetical protein